MKKYFVSLIVLVFAAAPAGAQNLVVDGSFEGLAGGAGWVNMGGVGTTFGAWTSNIDDLWLFEGSGQRPTDGTATAHIGDGFGGGSIYQVVTGFSPGGTYEVSIAAIEYTSSVGLEEAAPEFAGLRVTNEGAGTDDLPWTKIATPPWATVEEMEYSSFQFAASNPELRLEIRNPDGYAMNIDDVSIILIAPGGPEIGTSTPLSDPMEVKEADPNGTAVQFSVVLDVQPNADVVVPLIPGVDLVVEGGSDPNGLIFTSANWNTPQTVTVKAFDDM